MHNIIAAKYIDKYQIELEFDDNIIGIVDFSYFLEKNGVFNKFKDINFFKSFFINPESQTIEWPGEIDLCPDNLYRKI